MNAPARRALLALLTLLASTTVRAQDRDAGAPPLVEHRRPLESVMGGVPSEEYGSAFVGCEVVSRGATAEIRCPTGAPMACEEVARHDLAPDAGDEIVLGCAQTCGDDEEEGIDAGPSAARPMYPVVVVLSVAGPLAAIATTADMSCGSEISFRRAGRRWQFSLAGGGEDGSYDATYGYRQGQLRQIRMDYDESDY
jgi:hypothetical protein